jgi:hypothetical protein
MTMTSLTKIGGGLGVDPEAGDWRSSMDSSVERAEKRFWVVVGCSQWRSFFGKLGLTCGVFLGFASSLCGDLSPGDGSLGGRLIHCQIRWVVIGRCCG